MTFYNVLSALLFVGTLRVLLLGVEASNWSSIFASGCLAVLVFNDMLSTSHEVESRQEVQYEMRLMLIDLVNFLILALAMIVISPKANLFDVDLTRTATLVRHNTFWLLLTVYWISLMGWTLIAKRQHDGQSKLTVFFQSTVAGAFFIEWLATTRGLTGVARVGRPLVLVYLLLYLILIRRLVRRATDASH
jgi:hypothetical protein